MKSEMNLAGLISSLLGSLSTTVAGFEQWINDHHIAIGLTISFVVGFFSVVSVVRGISRERIKDEIERKKDILGVHELKAHELESVAEFIKEIQNANSRKTASNRAN